MKKAIINGALLLAIGLLLWDGSPVWAQDFKHRLATRGRVWDVFWNTGNQGVWEQFLTTEYRAMSFSYPGQFVPDYRWDGPEYYGGQRSFAGLQPYQSSNMEMTALSAGLDMFIATVVGGDYFVTETKPPILSEDVFAIAYDPSQGPEANIGYPNISPGGAPMANWWPGQPLPGPEFPVEIHNYRYFQYMDPDKDMFAENTIISNYATKRGITVTKKAYSWSYPGYSDFIILDLTFENTGDSDGDGVADLNGGAGLQLDDTFFIFSSRYYHFACRAHVARQHCPIWLCPDRPGQRRLEQVHRGPELRRAGVRAGTEDVLRLRRGQPVRSVGRHGPAFQVGCEHIRTDLCREDPIRG